MAQADVLRHIVWIRLMGRHCWASQQWHPGVGNRFRWVLPTLLSSLGVIMKTRSTTILTVRHGDVVAIGGDGQVTVGNSIMKADAVKLRRLMDERVLVGFAGATADAFALLERFEAKLKDHPENVPRASPGRSRQVG